MYSLFIVVALHFYWRKEKEILQYLEDVLSMYVLLFLCYATLLVPTSTIFYRILIELSRIQKSEFLALLTCCTCFVFYANLELRINLVSIYWVNYLPLALLSSELYIYILFKYGASKFLKMSPSQYNNF